MGDEPAAHVDANGNPFTGGLAFDPAEVSVEVTDVVEWTNTDDAVPHTATEDHMLWQLSGDYGDPAGAFQGFGPGETVSRDFDAGTFSYYCEVHPEEMRGVVKVPVKLRTTRNDEVVARWGSGPLPDGQVFDVQIRGSAIKPRHKWRILREGERETRAVLPYAPPDRSSRVVFRARVRERSDPNAVSGWSPRASVVLD